MSSPSLPEVLALFGSPVAGNPTQYLMEGALAEAGLDWRFLTLEVAPEALPQGIAGMRAMGFLGCVLAAPHKAAALPLLDELSQSARLIGAVNCVRRETASLVGENTEGKGFVQSLRALVEPAGKQVVVLGAGGAARAIAFELALAGAGEITIVGRTPRHAEELADALTAAQCAARGVPWEGDYSPPETTDVLVNATSIGTGDADARVPVSLGALPRETIVADVVFNPVHTRLLREARERGLRTLDGLAMLVQQAAINFRIWTGREPDTALMRDALEEFLGV